MLPFLLALLLKKHIIVLVLRLFLKTKETKMQKLSLLFASDVLANSDTAEIVTV